MKTVIIDGRRMKDRAGTHAYLAKKIGAPAHYGQNLDALRDVLTDCAEPTRYLIRYPASVEKKLGGYGASLLRVFRDAAEENENVTVELLPPAKSGS